MAAKENRKLQQKKKVQKDGQKDVQKKMVQKDGQKKKVRDAPWGFLVIVSCPLDEPVQGWQRSCTTFSCQRAMAVPHQHTAARDLAANSTF